MADPAEQAASLFRNLKQNPSNKVCFECNKSNPQWASVPLGILICLDCAGKHRSLGVHLSFVRSITMDSWSPKQMACMEYGGNDRAKAFFDKHGISEIANLTQKYGSAPAMAYKAKLNALSNGEQWTEPSPEEMKKMYKGSSTSSASASLATTPKPASPSPTQSTKVGVRPGMSGDYGGGNSNLRNSGYSSGGGNNSGGNGSGGYGGGYNSGYNSDWKNQYSSSSSISSADLFGNGPQGGNPQRRGGGGYQDEDYSQYIYDGWNTVSKAAGDVYNNVATKAKEVDWNSLSQSAQQTATSSWNVALDYFNKAKQFVGDGYNSLNEPTSQGMAQQSQGYRGNGYGEGSYNAPRPQGSNTSNNRNQGQRSAPPRNDDDVWDNWDTDLTSQKTTEKSSTPTPAPKAVAAASADMWDFDVASSPPKEPAPIQSQTPPIAQQVPSAQSAPVPQPSSEPAVTRKPNEEKWDDDWDKTW